MIDDKLTEIIRQYGMRNTLQAFIRYIERITVRERYLDILQRDLNVTLMHYESRYENDE